MQAQTNRLLQNVSMKMVGTGFSVSRKSKSRSLHAAAERGAVFLDGWQAVSGTTRGWGWGGYVVLASAIKVETLKLTSVFLTATQ